MVPQLRKLNSLPSVLLVLVCGLLITQGCRRPSAGGSDVSAPPFSFRALDLRQRTSDGQPSWTLKSPQARYDLRSNVARALRPEGEIFAKGQPLYKLAATTGTVINDGAVILLEGDIRLQRLGNNPLLISADRALWIPRESLMRFELNPQVRNLHNRISAQRATLHLDKDLLAIRGEPRLERWSKPAPLNSSKASPSPELLGTAKALDWRPRTGELKGEGPVILNRRPAGRPADQPPQRLKANRLEGNTLQEQYTLYGPVRMDDPAEKSWFEGGDLTFNSKESWLSSPSPFQLQRGNLEARGEGLRLDGQAHTATIGKNCTLQQGKDDLQSQRCQWNWKSQAVNAEGDVTYQRLTSRQVTKAQRLEGQLGPKGFVRATSPGGKVVSQLKVPRGMALPQPQKDRPKPEPIVF